MSCKSVQVSLSSGDPLIPAESQHLAVCQACQAHQRVVRSLESQMLGAETRCPASLLDRVYSAVDFPRRRFQPAATVFAVCVLAIGLAPLTLVLQTRLKRHPLRSTAPVDIASQTNAFVRPYHLRIYWRTQADGTGPLVLMQEEWADARGRRCKTFELSTGVLATDVIEKSTGAGVDVWHWSRGAVTHSKQEGLSYSAVRPQDLRREYVEGKERVEHRGSTAGFIAWTPEVSDPISEAVMQKAKRSDAVSAWTITNAEGWSRISWFYSMEETLMERPVDLVKKQFKSGNSWITAGELHFEYPDAFGPSIFDPSGLGRNEPIRP